MAHLPSDHEQDSWEELVSKLLKSHIEVAHPEYLLNPDRTDKTIQETKTYLAQRYYLIEELVLVFSRLEDHETNQDSIIGIQQCLRYLYRLSEANGNVFSFLDAKTRMTEPRPDHALSLEDISDKLKNEYDEALEILGTSSSLLAELVNPQGSPSRILPRGQVWVWLNNAEVPHWEIRGLGAIIEKEENE